MRYIEMATAQGWAERVNDAIRGEVRALRRVRAKARQEPAWAEFWRERAARHRATLETLFSIRRSGLGG